MGLSLHPPEVNKVKLRNKVNNKRDRNLFRGVAGIFLEVCDLHGLQHVNHIAEASHRLEPIDRFHYQRDAVIRWHYQLMQMTHLVIVRVHTISFVRVRFLPIETMREEFHSKDLQQQFGLLLPSNIICYRQMDCDYCSCTEICSCGGMAEDSHVRRKDVRITHGSRQHHCSFCGAPPHCLYFPTAYDSNILENPLLFLIELCCIWYVTESRDAIGFARAG